MAANARIQELHEHLATKQAEMDTISASFKTEEKSDEGDGGVGLVVSSEKMDAFRKALGEATEIKELIQLEEGNAGIKAFGDQPDRVSVAALAAALAEGKSLGGGAMQMPRGPRTIAKSFVESKEFQELVDSGAYTMRDAFHYEGPDFVKGIDRREVEQKDVYTASVATTPTRGFGTVEWDPIVPRAHRTWRVRDLFPARPTTANLIDFFRVRGFTNNASVVAERSGGAFGLKPQSTLTFDVQAAPVRTIAHYEAAHRNVLADAPQLQSIIESELMYGLQLQEDYQILSGTGTGEDLLGILNTPFIQTYTQGASNPPASPQGADAIRRAATLAFLAFYEPTGIVLHPYDWEEIELLKDSQNRYIVAGSVSMGADQMLWRMPVVQTPAIAQHTALVGAFGIAAQLYDREQSNIRIAEQHADFFLRNAIAILAEERLALAVKRPEAFVAVTLS